MFKLNDIIIHKETGIKAIITDICASGYCIKTEDGYLHHPDGATISNLFRVATSDDDISSFRGNKHE